MAANITLKELAAILNVSISTISKALNDSHEISESTKKRIKELATLHNYQPNKIAVGLKSGKTNTIGVILPSIKNNFFARVLFGIEKYITQTKYNIIVCITNESIEKEARNMSILANGVVDGFIVAAAEETQVQHSFDHFNKILEKNKPIVMFDRIIDSVACDKVKINDYEAVYQVTEKVLNTGRKNIVFASAIHNLNVGKLRTQGGFDIIEKRIGKVNPKYHLKSNVTDVRAHLTSFIANNEVDAIIALDEDSSFAALKACKTNNKSVPKDIAVIGYCSERVADNLNPELTTINQHGTRTGETAAGLLVEKLNAKTQEKSVKEIIISSTLNHRITF